MSDALTMTGRSLRLSARSPEALLTALLLPVMLMWCSSTCSAGR